MPIQTVTQSKSVTPSEKHTTLLQGYYEAWVTIEKNDCPPPILRCFISSLRLAINTLDTVENELKVLLELALERLSQIEGEDAAVAVFDHSIGRTK